MCQCPSCLRLFLYQNYMFFRAFRNDTLLIIVVQDHAGFVQIQTQGRAASIGNLLEQVPLPLPGDADLWSSQSGSRVPFVWPPIWGRVLGVFILTKTTRATFRNRIRPRNWGHEGKDFVNLFRSQKCLRFHFRFVFCFVNLQRSSRRFPLLHKSLHPFFLLRYTS